MAATGDTLIIGAGPAGLAAARALREHDLPYAHVERHDAIGGLWDIDNPGSPMYDSAHFISSKTLSGFSGFPMPDEYPDYPHHRQILAYLKAFADHYGLTEAVRTGTTVERIVPTRNGAYEATFADGTTSTHTNV
ncbi:NAD(P)-binding protein, partial [Demequina sp. NBRC 110053]|uniref:NAD(P)-binding protein n=1 Tax=Demequina sp. NBRC 110053 TaxID=1570342 RepID=UPI0013565F94